MAHVKRGVPGRARHKKILRMAKGYRGRAKNSFRIAIEKVGEMTIPVVADVTGATRSAISAPFGSSASMPVCGSRG